MAWLQPAFIASPVTPMSVFHPRCESPLDLVLSILPECQASTYKQNPCSRPNYSPTALALILRLINRGMYQLALEICNYLSIPPANGEVKVLREWALRKVGTRQSLVSE